MRIVPCSKSFSLICTLQAIQTAISEAFSTPEVIRMFAKREPGQLKQRLAERERDFKLGHIHESQFKNDKV